MPKVNLRKPSLPTRLWAASVFAAVFYLLFVYGLVDTQQQVALTLLSSAVCGFAPKIPNVETPKDDKAPDDQR